ncbi:MAG: septal ring lytic transglycosylase RlpA family protein [Alloprevotella sp.]|nr:septal ring lytic transglycosylase RlpA family protein [Alloprevotella sp.]
MAHAQQKGMASYYGKALHGRKTSSGERFNMYAMTCAHRTLPFGTWINVRDVKTGKEVKVRVTDRGPFCKGRVVDLSYGAARDLGIVGRGVAQVEVTVVPKEGERPATEENMLREPEKMNLELKLYDPKTGNYYATSEWTRRELEAQEAAKQQQRHWRVLNEKLTAKVFK